ncbi:Metalloproteases (zincins), catalytic [Glarea lozoyensis ATCC 20868]|uniref:Metalloproteases (Zincins), catalytic n=1 Tax=Glarea lozoyensis (strain ATCC 20868 / MF5171) TaxID=1116229 RepID=S3DFR0_GLAL2|nr:Metalloproteases (zincins), catalytic [Glarea lozoyensis ATCC 20868]EPE30776.1 Metalloproteases (zincins), catalytic [Glarea lozoyensis ATCC 20868]
MPSEPVTHEVEESDIQNGMYIGPMGGPPFPSMEGVLPSTYLDPACNGAEASIVSEAWEGAKLIVEAQTTIVSDYDYNLPHKTWLGDGLNASGKPVVEYRSKSIADNFKKLARLYGGGIDDKEIIVWRCTEGLKDEPMCSQQMGAGVLALALSAEYSGRNGHGNRVHDDKEGQLRMASFPVSTAHALLHETWHYRIVSQPRTADYATGVETTYNLARREGTRVAFTNADSYTYDGLAIYLQQTFKSRLPPTTKDHLDTLMGLDGKRPGGKMPSGKRREAVYLNKPGMLGV